MAKLQLKRGTTAQVQAYTPADGEPVYDKTKGSLVVGDGSTVGGKALVAGSASKWTNARAVTFTGAATGTGNLDGSADVSIALALSDIDCGVLS